MRFRDYLLQENKIIYCANSLFSPLDRIGGYNIAAAIEDRLKSNGAQYSNQKFTFLPFKDTQQSDIVGDNKSHKIFELDLAKLQNAGALVARLDGIAKDSGVCMEVGYAYALGLPIGIFSTDFIWEGFPSYLRKPDLDFDPVLKIVATFSKHFTQTPTTDEYYGGQNQMLEIRMVSEFVDKCLIAFDNLSTYCATPTKLNQGAAAFIDIQGGKYEWATEEQKIIAQRLAALGIKSNLASRYTKASHKDSDPLEEAEKDLESLMKSTIAIFSADNIEMDAGSATLFGICIGLKIKTLLLYTAPTVMKGAGGQEMKLNLMIEQAADMVCSSREELFDKIHTLI